ncbi:MAG TPA: M28 family metallopeptidase [Thermoleophilaceae bacterium]|jgi:hypothetical protein|nr:M28 family metallopeptidase [Thermoleophilaceae bacterium]
MKALQGIADANLGTDRHPSRNAGEPGYKASVDYVANLMKQAGYNVQIQTYQFPYSSFIGTPTLSESSPSAHDFKLVDEWNPGPSQGETAGATVQAVGPIVDPPTDTPSSASGCDPDVDFAGFQPGNIALIQRGTCTFQAKIDNAVAHGASGVIIFNEGNPNPAGRIGVFNGAVPNPPTIPVAFTSFAVGDQLFKETQTSTPPVMSISIHTVSDTRDDYNLIAESKGGDPNHVLVVDGHLDAIYGAGMLDNGSGSVTILDIAQMMRKVHPRNKLRFIWFGGEELGELGSKHYVNNLSASELGKISYDLDSDVMATPNYSIGILDPAAVDFFTRTVGTQFPANVYEPSKIARDMGVNYFDSIGKNHIFFSPVGTDAEQFQLAGVPASGMLTGQDCCKTQEEVNLFGGYTGNYEGNVPSFDGGCVDNPFRWCDNLSNNDPNVLTFMSKAFADMTSRMANYNFGSSQASAARAATAHRAAARFKSARLKARARGRLAR